MAEQKDIIYTDSLQIANGDFVVAGSEEQHIEHIFTADNGHFRQWPLVGLGIVKYLNGPFQRQALKQAIRTQLKQDNFAVRTIKIDGSLNITVDAFRIS
ncbi:MAG: hypothetical protein ACQ9ET_00265 [Nitrosomonadaceae bacterium]